MLFSADEQRATCQTGWLPGKLWSHHLGQPGKGPWADTAALISSRDPKLADHVWDWGKIESNKATSKSRGTAGPGRESGAG
jgi:hypothetical protein